jgi:hypothetical protein
MSLSLKGSSAGSATRAVRSSTIHGSRAVVVPRRASRSVNVPQAFAGGSSSAWNEDAMRVSSLRHIFDFSTCSCMHIHAAIVWPGNAMQQ